MSAIWTKICGITRVEDAEAAAETGADAVGLVLYPPSPRAVSVESCQALFGDLSAGIRRVALFVDPDRELVQQAVDSGCVDLLQFHGSESEEFCQQFGVPYMKAVRVQGLEQARGEMEQYPSAEMILLDKYVDNVPGGTGQVIDWSIAGQLVSASRLPVVLAGGLNPDNVSEAITQVKPFGVDVSSGVEKDPGEKDLEAVRLFIEMSKSV